MGSKRLLIEGLVLLAFGLVGLADGLRLVIFKNPASVEDITGPGRYLVAVSLLLTIVGVLYLAMMRGNDEPAPSDREETRSVVWTVVVLGLYVLLIDLIGYFWATQIFFLLILQVVGLRLSLRMVLIGAAMGMGFYMVFIRLFGMSLPRGFFPF